MKLQLEVTAEDPDIEKIMQMIEMDQAITGELLKTANSPFYKGLDSVDTVRDAILRLGMNEVANLVMFAIHRSNFKSDDPLVKKYMKQLWTHSVACAIGSKWAAEYLSLEQILPQSFIAGLLHDMGKLFLITAIGDIRREKDRRFDPSPNLVEKIMESLHASQGYELLTTWNLPEAYCIVARDHHALEFDTGNLLLTLVRLVNRVCVQMGVGTYMDENAATAGSVEADLLGLSEIAIAELQIKIEDSLNTLA
jgi:HD-like signal output (HDOD) protein